MTKTVALACTTMVSVLVVSAVLNLISFFTASIAAVMGMALLAIVQKIKTDGQAPVRVSSMLYESESLRGK